MVGEAVPELEARLAEASGPVERVDALNALAWAMRTTEIPRANALAREARELADEHGYTLGKARATRTLGMTIVDMDGLRRIFDLAREAKALFDEAGDDYGRAGSRDFLSVLHEHVGDLAGGLQLGLEALTIARAIDDPVRQGYALSSVGGILAASGEVDAGVERLEEALELFERVGDQQGVYSIRNRLATVLRTVGRYDEAATNAQICWENANARNDDFGRAQSRRDLARIALERGDDEEAERIFRDALDGITNPVARNVMGAEIETALGRILIARGALDEAEKMLVDAVAVLEGTTVATRTITDATQALAELYEKKGDTVRALEHLKRVLELREQITQQEAKNKIAQVEARAEIEAAKKDAEIHQLRYVELHGMQSRVVEAEKMALLGRLAAGTAHELNTPLGVLRSNNELTASSISRLLEMLDAAGVGDDRVAKMKAALASSRKTTDDAVARVAEIATRLGRFAELDNAERRPFDVRECLEAALAILESSVAGGVAIERNFGEVPRIEGWPRELNHAFMTVLRNAIEAIDGAGAVTVETIATDAGVVVKVRDTGRGMSDEEVSHLFDVAWSDGGARTSMRFGLSAAYATAQKHGGGIDVSSVLGEGTTVTFRFPASAY